MEEAGSSKNSRDAGYSDRGFSSFPSIPQGKCWDITLQQTTIKIIIIITLILIIMHKTNEI
jgi:hypothetical protein